MESIGRTHTGAYARFGAWSKRAAIISLGVYIPFRRLFLIPLFFITFLFFSISMNPLWNEMKDPPKMLENDTLFLAVTDKLLRSAATCRRL